jgi:hypothetical protein
LAYPYHKDRDNEGGQNLAGVVKLDHELGHAWRNDGWFEDTVSKGNWAMPIDSCRMWRGGMWTD